MTDCLGALHFKRKIPSGESADSPAPCEKCGLDGVGFQPAFGQRQVYRVARGD